MRIYREGLTQYRATKRHRSNFPKVLALKERNVIVLVVDIIVLVVDRIILVAVIRVLVLNIVVSEPKTCGG